ncbi:beta strand repeat-containing protein [Sphingopyxis kveilinensis]|uniref:beta strand repeat-containing protein n=1 Tax=Sphingopyxis kveilinensis TaxID=3114367 RepID=UPI0030D44134
MDAFDNPARNQMDGLQRDGASIDPSNGAVAGSDLLAATAQVTAAVSATPLAIQAILVPDASGRIVLPAGTSIDDITVSGTDLIVALPNGQVLIIPNGAVDVPAIVIDGDTVPASTVAQLLEGLADFNPEAGLRSSGGNFADPEGPIQDAYALGDLLPYTELAFPQPEDEELIPDVPDEEPTVVIVTPDQPAGATAATASVDEAGLPQRGEEPAGSNSAATSETTTGSIVYDAADGLGSITINGTAITAVGQVVTTPLGQLTITGLTTGNVGYSYTLADNTDAGANLTDVFTVSVTDRDGDTATATLTIDIIDDVPTARADIDQVAVGSFAPETGNVLTGVGTTSGAAGSDTTGADGASLTGVRPAGSEGGFAAPGTVAGQYGALTLNADGSYSYIRSPGTPGGVDDVFTYQITDGDGDISTATLTISIADSPAVITFVPGEGEGGTTVYEADLPGRNGETPGSAFGGGGGGGASTSATITFTAIDGVGSVSLGGTIITPGSLPQTVSSDATGTLVVTGYSHDPATGEGSITYVYTLTDNKLDADGTTVSFDLTITDVDGDAASDTLDIQIVDDAPAARDDADSVTEDGPLTADGNVLTGLGGGDANATDGVADTQGADGAAVTAVTGGAIGEPLVGAYGTLTLNSDGSYSYVLNNAAQPVQGLSTGDTLTEVFTYTITDGDGDLSSATLTITINGADDGVTIEGLEAQGGEVVVDEDNLADGSSPDAAALTQPGSFTISSPDGLDDVTIGGVQVVTNGVFTAGTATSPLGTINITGFTPVTGADGSVIGGTFTYEYVLADSTLTHPDAGEDFVGDSFAVLVTDSDGSSANASLDVRIIDDVPAAADDSASAAEDMAITIDVLANDVRGADGVDAATSVALATAPAKGNVIYNGDGSFTYTPTPGEEGEDSFTYTITDGDGDTSTATVTVTLADDSTPTLSLGADNSVDEAGLPAGSDAASNGETATGSFVFTTGNDGVASLVINGVDVTAGGTVTTPFGVLTVTENAGTYSYSYTLTTNTAGDGTFDSFSAVLTDSDGDTAADTLVIDIIDDVPTARPDTDSVTEDGPLTADGNVLTGSGGSDFNATDGVADTQGADGATVTAVGFGAAVGSVGAGLAGAYGTLTLNSDGSYRYVLNNSAQPVQGLSQGDTLSEVFTYTITDGDGDPATATLTITINGADDGVTITGLDAQGTELAVDEDDLPVRTGEAPGSDTSPEGVTDGDSFSVSTPDGMGSVVLDSFNGVPLGTPLTLVTADGSFTPQSVATAYGTLNITGFTPVTGADGSVIGGTFTYSYLLTDNRTDHSAMGEDDRTVSIGVTVTDIDGSSANDSIDIRITDDVPDAIDDAATQTLENAPVTIDVLGNDVQGADSVQPSAVELVQGSLTGTGSLVYNGDGSFTYTPAAQEIGTVSFQYQITDGDGDTDIATATITLVADSIPQIRNADDVTVDEDGLLGANIDNGLPGEVTSTGSASASGTITVDFGSDIPAVLAGSLVLDDSAALDAQLTVGGVPVTFAKDGGDLVGSVGGDEVIRISLTTATAGPGATEVTYGYSVTLSQAIDQTAPGSEDSDFLSGIGFIVTDNDGTPVSGAFDVTIVDDLPALTVSDIPTSVVEGATVGGSWTLDAGADGVASVLVEFGSGSATLALTPGSSVSIAQPTGTLTVNSDGSFSFAAVNNQNNAANPSATFTLSAVDRDGDPTSDSLTIAITDGADPLDAAPITLTVNEAAIDTVGSDPASGDEIDSGSLSFTAGSDTLSGFAFTGVSGLVTSLDGAGPDIFWSMAPDGQTITGSLAMGGPAAITISLTAPASIAPGATANAIVTVTLADNLPHALAMAAQTQALGTVTVQASDTDGDVASGVVTIEVTDDIPAAAPDTDSVTEDGSLVADGNVLTGNGGGDTTATDGVADEQGADGASVTALLGGTVGVPLVSTYGTLTLNSDGSYSYTLDNANSVVQGLSAGETLTEIFTYTITDGDGDPSTTTLTITINGANDGVTINRLAIPDGEETVNEDDLANGSSPNAAALIQPGSFTVDAPDGLNDVIIGSAHVMVNGVFTPGLTTSSALGTVTITGFTPVLAADNSVIGGTFTYEYVLDNNTLTHPAPGEDKVTDSFAVTVTDSDGSIANASLDVRVIDDVPTAASDPAIVVAEDAAPVGGNLLANDVQGADGATVTSVTIGGTVTAINAVGTTVIATANGTYSFTATGVWTFDPNPVSNAAAVDAGFSYTITDGDGDISTAVQAISLVDGENPGDADSIALALDDQNLADGSTPAGSDSDSDMLVFTPGSDAIASIVFGNSLAGLGGGLTWERVSDTQITGSDGTRLVVTLDLVRSGDSATVSATLNDNYDGHLVLDVDDLAALGSVDVIATDTDGDTATGSVAVTISDDVPTARADTDAVAEDATGGATGNVITGAGTTNAPGSADTQGADGAVVTGVVAGASPTAVSGNVGSALGGSYGSLTLNASGGYTYTLSNSNATVQALGVNESLTETFTYTITDGDGDTSTTTLTIRIDGSNDAPTIGSATTAVSDEGLAGGFPDNLGTVDTTNLAVRTGTIAVGDVDGDALTVSLGTPAMALSSGGQPILWDTSNPQMLLGKVGTETIVSVAIDNSGNFNVSLLGPIDHPDTTQEDALSLVIPVSVFDGTTTVTNATALTIGLEDDSPIAIAPLAASLINAPGSSVYQALDADLDVDNNYGGDGPGSVIFTAATIAALHAQGLTSGGQALAYSISADGTVLTAEKPNGDDVFVIRLQPAGHADQYQVQMIQKLDSNTTVDFNSGGYNFVGGNTAWVGFVKAGDNNSQDLLITPMKNNADGGTVNANDNETGVDNNNVGANEAVRVDFVIDLTGTPGNGQDYGTLANQNHAFDSHYKANGASALFTNITSSSSVRLVARDDVDTDNDIGDGVKDTITKVSISFNNATLSATTNGTYNVGGQNFTVTFANGEATVTGVVSNTVIAGFTADGYNSIEFHHAGGNTFKIGDFGAVVQTEDPVNFDVPVTIVDGDDDTAQGSLAITTASPLLVIGSAQGDVAGEPTDHVVANPQGLADGPIEGGNFDDTLVGDPGSVTITEGQQANVVLVLDSSGSMTDSISFGGGTVSRMQALKNGVNALIDSLSQSGAQDIRITVIDFDANGSNLGTFNLIVNGVVQNAQVLSAKAAVNGMSAAGGTNFEDGLQDALSWINGGNGIAGADVNKVVFVSDGNPTYWNSGGTGQETSTNIQNAMNQVLGSDGSNEPQQILATGYSIDAVGINVSSTLLARLSDVEDGNASGGSGSATNATSAEQLAAVLQVLGGSTDLAAAGNDVINGGNGADVIFGDVLYTDALAAQLGVSLSPGSGWAVFQTLEGRVNAESIDPANNGADWNRQDTIAYIRANYTALAQESGRNGGNDTINAGVGNDIILGQEGNDTINAGGGDDLIRGGTGRDVMTGGAGSDTYIFNAGDSRPTLGGSGNGGTITGHDVITDFNLAADILNLPGTPVPDGNGTVDGTNSVLTISGQAVRSHSVTNGVITFDDANSFSTALTLSSDAHVAAAVDYLQRNDLGPAGTTVAFVAETRTFVYQQVGTTPDPANDILVELQGVTITNLSTLIGTRITPVTLDLDGDGLDFVSASAGAAFDYDGDGAREATSWVGSGDGILARDANGDGVVNDGGEIVFSVGGSTDLEGLRLQYDSNGDGRLSAEDTAFASFGVWQDGNGNGISEAGEYRSLADLGIVSITLASDGNAYVAGAGEVIVHGEASYTRADGSTGAVGDVSFITPRAANDTERTAGHQALTSTLVAASLVAMIDAVQPDEAMTAKFAAEPLATAEAGVLVEASEPDTAIATDPSALGIVEAQELRAAPDAERTAVNHENEAVAATLDMVEDRGDRSNDHGASDEPAEALFDLSGHRAEGPGGTMDGLLALGEHPVAAVVAATEDPNANAVLAEVLDDGNAIDRLINAVAGAAPVEMAHGENPAFDLAQLLDQKVVPDAAFAPAHSIEIDLHQMATA